MCELYIDEEVKPVSRGDVAYIKREQKHSIKGITDLYLIEVQIGDELIEGDIERFKWDFFE